MPQVKLASASPFPAEYLRVEEVVESPVTACTCTESSITMPGRREGGTLSLTKMQQLNKDGTDQRDNDRSQPKESAQPKEQNSRWNTND